MNAVASDPATRLLDRLDRVRQAGPGRWIAPCPAHDDQSPSLSIREGDDGRCLVHCFAGCHAADVLAAVGLELRDLFPVDGRRDRNARAPRLSAADALRCLHGEASAVLYIAARLRASAGLSDDELARVVLASERIAAALAAAGLAGLPGVAA